jgi:hypothetical protein
MLKLRSIGKFGSAAAALAGLETHHQGGNIATACNRWR